jgi:hypothetical protein
VTRDDTFLLFEAVFLGAPFLSFMTTILRASSRARHAPSSAAGARVRAGMDKAWWRFRTPSPVWPGGSTAAPPRGFYTSFVLGLVVLFGPTASSSALRAARGSSSRSSPGAAGPGGIRLTIVSAREGEPASVGLPRRTTRSSRTGGSTR